MGRFRMKENSNTEEESKKIINFTLEELEEMAQSGKRIPNELDSPGRILYLGLYRLYNCMKLKLINESEFENTKRKLISDYEVNSFNYNMWQGLLVKIKEAEIYVMQARKEQSYEAAQKALDIIYGLK